jgi:uncharacterized protein
MPTVAVVGASADRSKFGNKSVRAHIKAGYTVYPVNPRADTIEGLKVYRNLAEVPEPLDRISMYVPPKVGIELLGLIRLKSPQEFFLNPGSESDELVAEAESLGLSPIVACSILDVGEDPNGLD